MNDERVLVTGASGLLGGDLVELLERQSPGQTIALLHERSNRPCGTPVRAGQLVWGDLGRSDLGLSATDYRALQSSVTGVLHAGGTTQFSVARDEAELVNVRGTQHLLSFAAGAPRLRRFGFVSTAYVAGCRTGRIGEDELEHHAGFVNWYEWSKFEAERLVRSSGLPWAVYRPSTLAGSAVGGRVRQRNAVHRAVQLYHHGLAPMLPGRPDTPVDAVPDEFAAEAVAYLFTNFVSGETCHLCAGQIGAPTISELLDLTAQTFGRCDPRWAAREIEPPMLVDPRTFGLFEQTARETRNTVFVQVAEAMRTFVPQLCYPKTFDCTLASDRLRTVGIRPRPLMSYWPRIVESCLQKAVKFDAPSDRMRCSAGGLAATVANESHIGPVATTGSTLGRDAFEARLLAFVNERLLAQAGVDVGPDTYLFADGLVNSMRILDLVAFIERSLDLTIDDPDVTMEHFRTVRTIADSFASRGAES